MATVHRLLWGLGLEGQELGDWELRPWEIPAVGLPTRVAVHLFHEAIRAPLPPSWRPDYGPVTWGLIGEQTLLAHGRREQLGLGSLESPPEPLENERPEVRLTTKWEVRPHPAFFLPFLTLHRTLEGIGDGYLLYCNVLLLLTALDGGEAILDRLVERGTGSIPFEDRWGWRSRIHLPADTWPLIEQVFHWSTRKGGDPASLKEYLERSLGAFKTPPISFDDFVSERIDLRLSVSSESETVRTVRRAGYAAGDLPDPLKLERDNEALLENFVVRIGQISEWPDKAQVRDDFPRMSRTAANRIMAQVASAFQTPRHKKDRDEPALVILPESTIPQSEVGTLRQLVEDTGRACLAGLYWRALPPPYPGAGGQKVLRRWFVNEAELILPMGHQDRGPTSVRHFRVRKPVPAHIETGLAQALTDAPRPTGSWMMLKGKRWYRFLHPEWGDFSVAICSDLLDSALWRSLRGELLHLFMVGFNKDVDLFDSLTWVRAYENYLNLISVNHGAYGGSFLWTPKRKHDRELARLRGEELFLLADVTLDISGLLVSQETGVQDAETDAKEFWEKGKGRKGDYKSPPPGYQRRSTR